MRVVDASVVLTWILGQDVPTGSHAALEDHLTGHEPLAAPELLHHEVANVLVTGARLPAEAAGEAYDLFAGLEIATYSLGHREHAHAILIASRYRVSAYDAAYAALARALDCRLLTADVRLARALAPLHIVDLVAPAK